MSARKFAPLIAALLLATSVTSEAAGRQVRIAPLDSIEAQDLSFMREEEKVARDAYLALYEKWGLTPFSNIAGSEQRHMDALLQLLTKYRLPDPAAGLIAGEFTNPDLQALYNTLLARGLVSNVAALQVGGLIEETDILDLKDAMQHADNADLDQVYGNLQCGSRNHLRAFAGQLSAITASPYVAQAMNQAEVDAILATPRERCGR